MCWTVSYQFDFSRITAGLMLSLAAVFPYFDKSEAFICHGLLWSTSLESALLYRLILPCSCLFYFDPFGFLLKMFIWWLQMGTCQLHSVSCAFLRPDSERNYTFVIHNSFMLCWLGKSKSLGIKIFESRRAEEPRSFPCWISITLLFFPFIFVSLMEAHD